MTIASLSTLHSASLLTNQSSSTNSASSSASSSGSIGDQLLAALAQSQASGITADPLTQELVTLSPAALGHASTTPQTYNAQGLLQQVQSNMLLNDPFFQSDTTDTSGTVSNSLLQSLISSHLTPSTAANAAGTVNTAAATKTLTNTGSTTVNAQSQAAATTAGSTDPNANWAQLLKQNPSLASELVQSQTNHSLISMLGQ